MDNKTRVVDYNLDIAELSVEIEKLKMRIEYLEKEEWFRKHGTRDAVAYIENSFTKPFNGFQSPYTKQEKK